MNGGHGVEDGGEVSHGLATVGLMEHWKMMKRGMKMGNMEVR